MEQSNTRPDLFASIQHILGDLWDPIPGSPWDEYDKLIPSIIYVFDSALYSHESKAQRIEDILRQFELSLGCIIEKTQRDNAIAHILALS